jgi:hypothetical protein
MTYRIGPPHPLLKMTAKSVAPIAINGFGYANEDDQY